MSHYTVNYAKTPLAKKREKALNDTCEFLGQTRFDALLAYITEAYPKPTSTAAIGVRNSLGMFAGVEGYPVVAILATLWNLEDHEVINLFNTDTEN